MSPAASPTQCSYSSPTGRSSTMPPWSKLERYRNIIPMLGLDVAGGRHRRAARSRGLRPRVRHHGRDEGPSPVLRRVHHDGSGQLPPHHEPGVRARSGGARLPTRLLRRLCAHRGRHREDGIHGDAEGSDASHSRPPSQGIPGSLLRLRGERTGRGRMRALGRARAAGDYRGDPNLAPLAALDAYGASRACGWRSVRLSGPWAATLASARRTEACTPERPRVDGRLRSPSRMAARAARRDWWPDDLGFARLPRSTAR